MEVKHMQGLLRNGLILAMKLDKCRVSSVMRYFNENGINVGFHQTAVFLQGNGVQLTTRLDYIAAFGDKLSETP